MHDAVRQRGALQRRSTSRPTRTDDCYCWDGCTELGVYGGKHLNPTQRPWLECFTPLYAPGPWPPSYTFLGPTNLVRPKFYLYGDYRTAVANNNNVDNAARRSGRTA